MIDSLAPASISGNVELKAPCDPAQLNDEINAALEQDQISPAVIEQRYVWRYVDFYASFENQKFTSATDYSTQLSMYINLIPLEDYNAMTGSNVSLDESEALLFTTDSSFTGNTIQLGDETLHILQILDSFGPYSDTAQLPIVKSYYLVLSDFTYIQNLFRTVTGLEPSASLELHLNTKDDFGLQESIVSAIIAHTPPETLYNIHSRTSIEENWNSMYGSFLFLGLFLGSLFLMATVLIIYYKQISEGFDDHERFSILQKVGMSKKEVRSTINKQILLVFFLPLMMAFVHMVFAYNVICNILVIFGMTDRTLFLICCSLTFLAFALVYLLVYRITAHTYYRLVDAC